ncbi:GNAT family N-acetyltransferase [Actinosynnema sp. NPDC051121]|nr:GNAT family N-acetyltransferase [Saccharothrix sp.]
MEIMFRSALGLDVKASDDGGSELFDVFYEGYDQAFTLPDEKEERAGFVECLALNGGEGFERISARLGAFRELVVVAELRGEVVGGANLLVTPLREHHVVTVNLNYAYVLPGHRGKGLLRRLVAACAELAAWLFPGVGPVVTFLELNDPLLLTAQQYDLDSATSGVDQFDRVVIWARIGVRILDFPYVQPPLSPAQQADGTLMLGVLADPGFELSGELLADHLERFFAISVLKNGDLASNRLAADQVRECRGRHVVALLDPLPELDALRHEVGAAGPGLRERLGDAARHPA